MAMNYFELEGPESTSEKSPLVCQVPHRDVRRPSSVKPCLILGGILGFVLLFGLGLWKYRIAGQFISYSLGATPDGNTTVTWDTDLQVEVDQGILQGKQLISRAGRNYLAFLGIPYAQPPIGNLRFRPPVPAEPWEGVRNATYFRHTCIEKERVGNEKLEDQPDVTVGNEDCLYLNVYTPKDVRTMGRRKNLFPVMVYIHGGAGGAFGTGQKYGADYFMDEDVVLITLEFRLGVLGNLNTNTSLASGNQGLKDELMALEWVQDNIRAFGGDRRSVTIFGNSFGGIQVSAHMLSPLGKGLYHRAIAQSGSLLYPGFFTEDPLHDATRLGDLMGCQFSNSTNPNEELAKCFLNASASDLTLQSLKLKHKYNYVFTISVDSASASGNVFLPMGPLDSLQSGKIKSLPYLTGIVDAEGVKDSLEVMTDPLTLAAFQQNWTESLIPALYLQYTQQNLTRLEDMSLRIRDFYFGAPAENETERILGEDNFRNFTNIYTDRLYTHPAATMTNFLRQKYEESAGRSFFRRRTSSGRRPSAYFYHFSNKVNTSRADPLVEMYNGNSEYFGECHADELQFFFPFDAFPYIPMGHPYANFSQMVVKLWVNFARTGSPGAYDKVRWTPVDEEHPYQYLELNENPQMSASGLDSRITFWDQFNLTELYM